jgi:hypothetical protein
MPERARAELVAEAAELVELYRDLAGRTPASDVESAGFAIGRALKDIDPRWTWESLDRAARELAAARETLTRVRRTLGC